MQRIAVKSTSLHTLGYDDRRSVLEVEFRENRRTDEYCGVPATVVAARLDAESKGAYFNRHIKPVYRCRRVRRRARPL